MPGLYNPLVLMFQHQMSLTQSQCMPQKDVFQINHMRPSFQSQSLYYFLVLALYTSHEIFYQLQEGNRPSITQTTDSPLQILA